MVKISAETIKAAARNVNELMESTSPEIKMILENPNFAIGLCLVLHKEVQQLQGLVQSLQSESPPQRVEKPSPEPEAQVQPKQPQNQQVRPTEPVTSQAQRPTESFEEERQQESEKEELLV